MGRSDVAADEVGCLLQAIGSGDVDAFAALYDRTAATMFGLLAHVPGDSSAEERAMVRLYVRVWRTAPAFDPAVMSGGAFLIRALHQELDGRTRRDQGARASTTGSV